MVAIPDHIAALLFSYRPPFGVAWGPCWDPRPSTHSRCPEPMPAPTSRSNGRRTQRVTQLWKLCANLSYGAAAFVPGSTGVKYQRGEMPPVPTPTPMCTHAWAHTHVLPHMVCSMAGAGPLLSSCLFSRKPAAFWHPIGYSKGNYPEGAPLPLAACRGHGLSCL